ncbi:VOC family protein [Actinoplanes sp. TFC3]|uniref:VOC family protein n=1 Tax=Actinoplanes sp. TFC3 TaxID=1710355 RepID=UPI00083007A5|nr:glyoxalase/bleomycin resistance/extradiol dioxygenase family protein [Actinoplanes sp. TFC3]
MVAQLLSVTFAAQDPRDVARFWGELLGRDVAEDARSVVVPGEEGQVGLRFFSNAAPKAGPNRLHLHVTSDSLADQQQKVAAALKLGASHLDVGQRPEEGHIVLADPGGNEFCVIEPHNNFLAGCGLLGEVACDGTRAVGLFWAEVLGWPLVWDQDEETAIQSPQGGTKIAWGGPPLEPKRGRNRQHFDLAATGDRQDQIDWLVRLGATCLNADAGGAVELADPDGNEFCLW